MSIRADALMSLTITKFAFLPGGTFRPNAGDPASLLIVDWADGRRGAPNPGANRERTLEDGRGGGVHWVYKRCEEERSLCDGEQADLTSMGAGVERSSWERAPVCCPEHGTYAVRNVGNPRLARLVTRKKNLGK